MLPLGGETVKMRADLVPERGEAPAQPNHPEDATEKIASCRMEASLITRWHTTCAYRGLLWCGIRWCFREHRDVKSAS